MWASGPFASHVSAGSSYAISSTDISDPKLLPVKYISAADLLGRHLHANNVATSRVLRHSKRANFLARDEIRQKMLFLIFIPVQHQLVDAELRVCSIGQPDATWHAVSATRGFVGGAWRVLPDAREISSITIQ